MRVPEVVDLNSMQRLPDMLRRVDFHKIHLDLLNCLPSLPNMPDLQRLKDLKASFPSRDFLASHSGWNILELLTHCLPERLGRMYGKDYNVLVMPYTYYR